jgi:ferredoxin
MYVYVNVYVHICVRVCVNGAETYLLARRFDSYACNLCKQCQGLCTLSVPAATQCLQH